MEGCKHPYYEPAGYKWPSEELFYDIRVQSLYHVYCPDCGNFINLIDGSNINHMGLSTLHGQQKARNDDK